MCLSPWLYWCIVDSGGLSPDEVLVVITRQLGPVRWDTGVSRRGFIYSPNSCCVSPKRKETKETVMERRRW